VQRVKAVEIQNLIVPEFGRREPDMYCGGQLRGAFTSNFVSLLPI
jgi:hypothetical protein